MAELAANVWADGPSSNPHEPDKAQIRAWGTSIESELVNVNAAIVQTKSELESEIDDVRNIAASGFQRKEPVRAASGSSILIATGLENGDTLDGVTLVTGDRVLLYGQTSAAENGVYVVAASGEASRSTDADSASEVAGMAAFVREGTANGGKTFGCTVSSGITLGVTALPFVELSDQTAINANLADLQEVVEKDEQESAYGAYIRDEEGTLLGAFGNGEHLVGRSRITEGENGAIYIADEDGFAARSPEWAVPEHPSSLLPYFGGYLCGVEGEKLTIHLAGMLPLREDDVPLTWMELSSVDTRVVASGERQINVVPDEFGSTARLVVRPRQDNGGNFGDLPLTVHVLPQPLASPLNTKVCYVGDSLLYWQGGAIVSEAMTGWGIGVDEVGTLNTDGTTATPAGVLSEARPGHRLADLVYHFGASGIQQPVAPGDESVYLAMSTTDKRLHNYWLRVADVGDNPSDVVNGYVLDWQWGFSRMGLASPDVLVMGYFRNDATSMIPTELASNIYQYAMLVCRRWELDYPGKPIIWIVPPCAYSAGGDRNMLRDTRDVVAMRELFRAGDCQEFCAVGRFH
ncbi:hypothetical protein [Sinorhizobium meliloti]|uniref:hypothetical protein n=1 Tax=Rhizobium meliloti TaxID=382 RepID=UPI000FDBCA74|nr:hypothetical protein [Sinorhizobium meliloti]RVG91429.1 hypothetical protein CN218_20415 [Sinorhizobium meliloti]